MRLVPRRSLTPVPWKNGGGITRQIACFPDDIDLGSFDWRLSTAEVTQDGPFSRFDGIDRRLYILEGAGLDLNFATQGTMRLGPGDYTDFAGEDEVFGALVEGPVSDLNIMVRRARQRMQVEAMALDGARTIALPWETAAVFVMDGAVSVNGTLDAGRFDTVMTGAGDGPLTLEGRVRLLLIGFEPI